MKGLLSVILGALFLIIWLGHQRPKLLKRTLWGIDGLGTISPSAKMVSQMRAKLTLPREVT